MGNPQKKYTECHIQSDTGGLNISVELLVLKANDYTDADLSVNAFYIFFYGSRVIELVYYITVGS